MNADAQRVRSIFLAAVEDHTPDQWEAYLDEACAGDQELRRRVEVLLRAHGQPNSLLDSPAAALVATTAEPVRERPGTVIGPYRLMEQIGEGGMGLVFVAEQHEPVRRKVALKVIKPGLDTREVIARFEQERQALALMDHPHIAKVLDAGTTESGRPYFVMELVRGVPITQFCDEHRLTTRERLGLFVSVCRAVQHAHTKGVIHRDVKPSNVLVSSHDGTPVVKVIDFGVAKAIGPELTDKTVYTGFSQLLGTPLYMSPEQAGMSGLDIDTRTDIYALGVLLYELLTGTTPFEAERLRQAGYDEMRRIIREEEPPRPSTRISTLGQAAVTVSANRQSDPKQLGRLMRGELDWVVMKALEKDRNRRYETASAFAADIQRYLHDEPVQACPPSAWYRFGKFARRNKAALATAAVVGLAVLLAVGTIGWVLRDRATRSAQTAGKAGQALGEADRLRTQARWREARAAVHRAQALLGDSPEAGHRRRAEELLADLNMAEVLEGIRLDKAEVKDEKFDIGRADVSYAQAFRDYGIDVDALPAGEAAERIRARTIQAELVAALDDWALVRRQVAKPGDVGWKDLLAVARAADPDEWRDRLREALEKDDREALKKLAASAPITSLPGPTVTLLADALDVTGAGEDGLPLLRRAQEHYPGDFWINQALARSLLDRRQWEGAVRFFTAAAALRPDSPGVHVNLGLALHRKGDRDGAVAATRRAVDLKPDYANAHNNLGDFLRTQGRLPEAVAHVQRAIELRPRDAAHRYNLGLALREQRKFKEAIASYREAIELQPNLRQAHYHLGRALAELEQWDEAEKAYRRAIALKQDAEAHNGLGTVLAKQGKRDDAIKAYRKAVELQPDHPLGHFNLGSALREQRQLPEAILELWRAIDLQPKYADAWDSLGLALSAQGKFGEAEEAHRKAMEFHTDKAGAYRAHNNLGSVLGWQDRPAEAAAVFRKAIELQPEGAEAHYGLGLALGKQGKNQEAIASFRAAIDRKPDYAEAHGNLGFALQQEGEFAEALAALKRSHDLMPPSHPGRAGIQRLIKECARLVELGGRLPAVLRGEAQPANAAERAEFARVCAARKLYAAAARLYEQAFTEQPELAADPRAYRRFDAARAAARAGLGQGKVGPALGGPERVRWRKQALAWLRADLALLEQRSATPQGRASAENWLRLWQRSPDLVGLREEAALAELPEPEREAWRSLWTDVDNLLARVKPRPEEPPPDKP